MLAEAAALRGWTPTNLLRVAALERAAQILNTSRPTKLNLSRLAEQVAATLCEPREVEKQWEEPDAPVQKVPLEHIKELEGFHWWFTPPPLSENDVESLRQAVRLGGPDFLNRVLGECTRLLERDAPAQELPDPVDPDSFS